MKSFIEEHNVVDPASFQQIAEIILNNTILEVNKREFRICEIEFYLNSKAHPDQYTHSDEDQLEYGYWYFHKYKTGKYKGDTYKGMDIALGDKPTSSYCGILIRSIYDLYENEMIEGPCRSVNKILEIYKINSLYDFVGDSIMNVLKNHRNFILKDAQKKLPQISIYKGPRIGLSDKYPKYRNLPYRFLTYTSIIKKQKSKRTRCTTGKDDTEAKQDKPKKNSSKTRKLDEFL